MSNNINEIDKLKVGDRCSDRAYAFILYVCYKLGPLFDIYVNGCKVKIVNEEFSLYSTESGTFQLVMIDPTKKRQRKIDSTYWKQNGDENKLNLMLPDKFICTKRNFTKAGCSDIPKNKLWEYALFKDSIVCPENQFPCLLRHALKDFSNHVKYFTSNVAITLKSKNSYYFSSNFKFEIIEGDYDLVESIYSFALKSKTIAPNQCVDVDNDIRNIIFYKK